MRYLFLILFAPIFAFAALPGYGIFFYNIGVALPNPAMVHHGETALRLFFNLLAGL